MGPRFLIDTSLAVLLVVGLADRGFIARHKRLDSFDAMDFDILCGFLGPPAAWVFTPNVLTEVSNLTRYIGQPHREAISRRLAGVIAIVEERLVRSEVVVSRDVFLRLGLADAVLMEAAASDLTIVTADLELYLAASNAGLQVVNFTHVRANLRADFR